MTKVAGNRGTTTLKSRQRSENPMREFDRLPVELRHWVSSAALPWRAKSVLRAFENAYRKTGDRALALRELDRLQSVLVAKDARKIWGDCHPDASVD